MITERGKGKGKDGGGSRKKDKAGRRNARK